MIKGEKLREWFESLFESRDKKKERKGGETEATAENTPDATEDILPSPTNGQPDLLKTRWRFEIPEYSSCFLAVDTLTKDWTLTEIEELLANAKCGLQYSLVMRRKVLGIDNIPDMTLLEARDRISAALPETGLCRMVKLYDFRNDRHLYGMVVTANSELPYALTVSAVRKQEVSLLIIDTVTLPCAKQNFQQIVHLFSPSDEQFAAEHSLILLISEVLSTTA